MTEIVATLRLIKFISRQMDILHTSIDQKNSNAKLRRAVMAISFSLLGWQWRFLRWWQPQQGLQAHSFAYLWNHDAVSALAPEVKAN